MTPRLLASCLETAAFLYLAAVGVVLARRDLTTLTLPDRLVLPGYGVGAVALGATSLARGDPTSMLRALLGAVGLLLLYLLLALCAPGGMGFGDVKLAGVLGLFLGYLGLPQLLVGSGAAFVLGGCHGLVLLVRRAPTRTIPFGPWMLAGAWIGILAGAAIARLALFLLA